MNMASKKRLILQILISVTLFGVFISVYVRWGLPFIQELVNRRADSSRIADIDNLSEEIERALKRGATIGVEKTIYTSLPSYISNCSDLDLPDLPDGWKYHCVPEGSLQNSTGDGWLPINFEGVVPGEVSRLPLDPKNNAETLSFYSFVSENSTSTKYVLTATPDSKKFLREMASNDQGADPLRYELGSTALWSIAQGIIGFWPLNDEDPKVKDHSPYSNDGLLINNLEWRDKKLFFTGDGYIKIPENDTLSKIGDSTKNYSVYLWFKTDQNKDQSLTEKWINGTYPFSFRGPTPGLRFGSYDGTDNPVAVSNGLYADNRWHLAAGTVDHSIGKIRLYVDDQKPVTIIDTTTKSTANNGAFPIGARYLGSQNAYNGYIANVAIYARVLSPNEIKRLFDSADF
jgi:hypothetical protein